MLRINNQRLHCERGRERWLESEPGCQRHCYRRLHRFSIRDHDLPECPDHRLQRSSFRPNILELFATSPGRTTEYLLHLWIWELPFSQYQEGQQLLLMRSEAVQGSGFANGLLVSMVSGIPMPFGDTFSLQQPVVSSVSPTCVNAGDNFTINGTGFYPSMLSKVLIYNTSAHYTPVSDRQIQVVAPDLSGYELPVIVQTAKGQSNDDVKIEISVIHACDFK